eukprot:m.140865 g.140865  ORF g.140865 m.140865 type:complete len:499 (-) comp17095_c1_seq8:32-1528(-)
MLMPTVLLLLTVAAMAGSGVAAKRPPSIVFLLTDDQDVGSAEVAMPFTIEHIVHRGVNATRYFTTTPVCCPSRSAIISARYAHNTLNSDNGTTPGCMRQHKTAFPIHLQAAGIRTGCFGKFLNMGGMKRFCANLGKCTSGHCETPKGWDEFFGMCPDTCYQDCHYAHNGKLITPTEHTGYATSVIGNRSVEFVKKAINDDVSFFLYSATHAPHLPCTPAPWYKNEFQDKVAPRTASWNASGADKHWIVSQQPPLTDKVAKELDDVYRNRLRTLLSVDDITRALYAEIASAGRLNDTYFVWTSDHGFHLGEFRLGAAKRQVYETDIRVPLAVAGPGIAPGSFLSDVSSHIDLGPTFLDIVGAPIPPYFDGKSLLPKITGNSPHEKDSPKRTMHLVEYMAAGKLKTDVVGHVQCAPNNTYIAIRTKTSFGEFSYSEFSDNKYNFDAPYFYELYNLTADPLQLHNRYNDPSTPHTFKQELHEALHSLFKCVGTSGPNSCYQ